MQTPVWSSQPMPETPLRTVDLFPAMLGWLGVAVPQGIDGEPVWAPGGRQPSPNESEDVTLPDSPIRIRSSVS